MSKFTIAYRPGVIDDDSLDICDWCPLFLMERIDFTDVKVRYINLGKKSSEVSSWSQLYLSFIEILYMDYPEKLAHAIPSEGLVDELTGRLILSNEMLSHKMRVPWAIGGSSLYAEAEGTPNEYADWMEAILLALGIPVKVLHIYATINNGDYATQYRDAWEELVKHYGYKNPYDDMEGYYRNKQITVEDTPFPFAYRRFPVKAEFEGPLHGIKGQMKITLRLREGEPTTEPYDCCSYTDTRLYYVDLTITLDPKDYQKIHELAIEKQLSHKFSWNTEKAQIQYKGTQLTVLNHLGQYRAKEEELVVKTFIEETIAGVRNVYELIYSERNNIEEDSVC